MNKRGKQQSNNKPNNNNKSDATNRTNYYILESDRVSFFSFYISILIHSTDCLTDWPFICEGRFFLLFWSQSIKVIFAHSVHDWRQISQSCQKSNRRDRKWEEENRGTEITHHKVKQFKQFKQLKQLKQKNNTNDAIQ